MDKNLEVSNKLKRIATTYHKNEKIVILKLFENASMREVKFIVALIINYGSFKQLVNIRKEEDQLKLYSLNEEQHNEFRTLIDDEINEAIKNENFDLVGQRYDPAVDINSSTFQQTFSILSQLLAV